MPETQVQIRVSSPIDQIHNVNVALHDQLQTACQQDQMEIVAELERTLIELSSAMQQEIAVRDAKIENLERVVQEQRQQIQDFIKTSLDLEKEVYEGRQQIQDLMQNAKSSSILDAGSASGSVTTASPSMSEFAERLGGTLSVVPECIIQEKVRRGLHEPSNF